MTEKTPGTASPINSAVQVALRLLLALAVALVIFIFFIKVAKPVPNSNPSQGNPAKQSQ